MVDSIISAMSESLCLTLATGLTVMCMLIISADYIMQWGMGDDYAK